MTLTGCFVPEAKPQAIVDLLNGEIERAANDPAVRPRLEAKSNVLTLSPAAFDEKLTKETRELAGAVAKTNIRPSDAIGEGSLPDHRGSGRRSINLPRQAGFTQF
jgi:hypothetical protein